MSENKRKPKETVYDKLDKNEKAVQIPYYVHEMEMTRLDRINKRLWIILIVIFLAFVGTNAGWISGSYNDGMSYARGRDMRTGRYISRDDGYSGHYPMEYIDPMYWDRRY